MCVYESFCVSQLVRKIEIHFPNFYQPFRMAGTLTMADTLVQAAEHSSGGPSRARPSRRSNARPEIAKSTRKGLLMLQFLFLSLPCLLLFLLICISLSCFLSNLCFIILSVCLLFSLYITSLHWGTKQY